MKITVNTNVKPATFPCIKIWKSDLNKQLKNPLIVLFESKDYGVALSDSASTMRVGRYNRDWENANSTNWVDFEGSICFSK